VLCWFYVSLNITPSKYDRRWNQTNFHKLLGAILVPSTIGCSTTIHVIPCCSYPLRLHTISFQFSSLYEKGRRNKNIEGELMTSSNQLMANDWVHWIGYIQFTFFYNLSRIFCGKLIWEFFWKKLEKPFFSTKIHHLMKSKDWKKTLH
jgi:hypothetical protein